MKILWSALIRKGLIDSFLFPIYENASLLLLLSILSLVLVCPFSKVEESFNMQAIHDLLEYRWLLLGWQSVRDNFDHLQFPGVVPRTFIGPLLLSAIVYPFHIGMSTAVWLWNSLSLGSYITSHKVVSQYVVRAVLGGILWYCYTLFTRAIDAKFSLSSHTGNGSDGSNGTTTTTSRLGKLCLLLTALQFHLPYYMSRTLPNTFALALVLIAYSQWLHSRPVTCLSLLGVAMTVFRCDILVLLAPLALQMLVCREVELIYALGVGILVCLSALCVSITVDSYFWQRLLWPEGVVLFFNTLEKGGSRSAEWGTSPWYWYLSSALPRSLGVSVVMILCAYLGIAAPREEALCIENSASYHHHSNGSKDASTTGRYRGETVVMRATEGNEDDGDGSDYGTESTAGTNDTLDTRDDQEGSTRVGGRGRLDSNLTDATDATEAVSLGEESADAILTWQLCLNKQRGERYARIWYYSVPALLYVALYSLLPHKELRFIFPALPLLNMVAALGLDGLLLPISEGAGRVPSSITYFNVDKLQRQHGLVAIAYTALYPYALSLLLSLLFGAGVVLFAICLQASIANYPGAQALTLLLESIEGRSIHHRDLFVHIDASTATTGVTRFLQRPHYYHPTPTDDTCTGSACSSSSRERSAIHYSKAEDLPEEAKSYMGYDYLVTGVRERVGGGERGFGHAFTVLHTVPCFDGISVKPAILTLVGRVREMVRGDTSALLSSLSLASVRGSISSISSISSITSTSLEALWPVEYKMRECLYVLQKRDLDKEVRKWEKEEAKAHGKEEKEREKERAVQKEKKREKGAKRGSTPVSSSRAAESRDATLFSKWQRK